MAVDKHERFFADLNLEELCSSLLTLEIQDPMTFDRQAAEYGDSLKSLPPTCFWADVNGIIFKFVGELVGCAFSNGFVTSYNAIRSKECDVNACTSIGIRSFQRDWSFRMFTVATRII